MLGGGILRCEGLHNKGGYEGMGNDSTNWLVVQRISSGRLPQYQAPVESQRLKKATYKMNKYPTGYVANTQND